MRTRAPSLFPVFRSAAVAEILTLLCLHAEQRYSLADISKNTGVPKSTVHREIDRFVQAGILEESQIGRNRLVKIDVGHPPPRPSCVWWNWSLVRRRSFVKSSRRFRGR